MTTPLFQVLVLFYSLVLAEPDPTPQPDPQPEPEPGVLSVVKKATSYFPSQYTLAALNANKNYGLVNRPSAINSPFRRYNPRYTPNLPYRPMMHQPYYPQMFGMPMFYNRPNMYRNMMNPYFPNPMLRNMNVMNQYFNPGSFMGYNPYTAFRGNGLDDWTFPNVPIQNEPSAYFGNGLGWGNDMPSFYNDLFNPYPYHMDWHDRYNSQNSIDEKRNQDGSYKKKNTKGYSNEKPFDQYKPYDRNSYLSAAPLHKRDSLGKAKDSSDFTNSDD